MSGRPRKCDRDQVAQRAITRFWLQGLAGTSVEELVADTGLNRFGLYGELGGKKGLFLKACTVYSEDARRRWMDPLRHAVDPEAGLQVFFRSLIAGQIEAKDGTPRGCLLANALAEDALADAEISRLVRRHFSDLERTFARLLERAAGSRRQPATARAAREGARCLLNALFGILQMARLHPSRRVLHAIADRAVLDAIALTRNPQSTRREARPASLSP